MTHTEQEMVRELVEQDQPADHFTSLQPTYEDSVPPEDDWDENS
jgi:hypothetical protein